MNAYLVIVIKNPTAKAKHDEGKAPYVVVQPTAVIAKDESTAGMKALRLVPEEEAANLDLLEVAVMPFRRVGIDTLAGARA